MTKEIILNGSRLIKNTGMKLKPLSARLNIPYATLQAYSCGKRNIPPMIVKMLQNIIENFNNTVEIDKQTEKLVMAFQNAKRQESKLSDEQQHQLMQKIADDFDKKKREPLLQRLMDATGLSEEECLNLKWSDVKTEYITCPKCGYKSKKKTRGM